MPGASFLTRYLVVQVSAPANTPQATPVTATFDLGNVELERLWIIIPAGHAGLTGIAVEYETTRIIPFGQQNDFIISDDEDISFDINAEVGHPLTIVMFNKDIFVHEWHLRAKIRSLDAPSDEGTAVNLIDLEGES